MVGTYFVTTILQIAFNIMEGGAGSVNSLVSDDYVSWTNAFLGFSHIKYYNFLWTLPTAAFDFFTEIIKMLVWDYSFLNGSAGIIKFVFLYPISVGFAISIMYMSQMGIQGILRKN